MKEHFSSMRQAFDFEAHELFKELERMFAEGEPRENISSQLFETIKLRMFDSCINELRFFMINKYDHEISSEMDHLMDIITFKL